MSAPVRSDPPLDPRAVRVSGGLTAVVLVIVLLSGSAWLLAAQAAVFALGAFAGPQFAPYPVLYRGLVAPRLGPPTERADAAPVRLSQLVGLALTATGLTGYLAGLTALGVASTAFALAAALLDTALGHRPGAWIHTVIATIRTTQGVVS